MELNVCDCWMKSFLILMRFVFLNNYISLSNLMSYILKLLLLFLCCEALKIQTYGTSTLFSCQRILTEFLLRILKRIQRICKKRGRNVLAILQRILDRAMLFTLFIRKIRLTGFRASITFMHSKILKWCENIARSRFVFRIARRSIPWKSFDVNTRKLF